MRLMCLCFRHQCVVALLVIFLVYSVRAQDTNDSEVEGYPELKTLLSDER